MPESPKKSRRKTKSRSPAQRSHNGTANSKRSAAPHPTTTTPTVAKRIRVYRNGDRYHKGIVIVLNIRHIHDINALLDAISERVGLVGGAKRLYTLNGVPVRTTQELENNKEYVASSGGFLALPYGQAYRNEQSARLPRKEYSGMSLASRSSKSSLPGRLSRSTSELKSTSRDVTVQSVSTVGEGRKSPEKRSRSLTTRKPLERKPRPKTKETEISVEGKQKKLHKKAADAKPTETPKKKKKVVKKVKKVKKEEPKEEVKENNNNEPPIVAAPIPAVERPVSRHSSRSRRTSASSTRSHHNPDHSAHHSPDHSSHHSSPRRHSVVSHHDHSEHEKDASDRISPPHSADGHNSERAHSAESRKSSARSERSERSASHHSERPNSPSHHSSRHSHHNSQQSHRGHHEHEADTENDAISDISDDEPHSEHGHVSEISENEPHSEHGHASEGSEKSQTRTISRGSRRSSHENRSQISGPHRDVPLEAL